MRGIVRPVVALISGLALIVVAALVLGHRVPAPTDAGVVPGAAGASPVSPRAATLSAAPSGDLSTQAVRSASATGAGGRAGVDRTAGAVPSWLSIPTLSVAAPVASVEVVGGELQVPSDPRTVGWWRGSVAPGGDSGSTVIDGHIDSAVSGIGALFHLADLGPGDEVMVRSVSGVVFRYTVQARRVYVKAAGLPADIFSQTGSPRLVLISCGGPFDAAARSYRDNIVVYATPRK